MSIRDKRLAAGMTQYELADKLMVDQAAVSNWENGKNSPLLPSPPVAQPFSACFLSILRQLT